MPTTTAVDTPAVVAAADALVALHEHRQHEHALMEQVHESFVQAWRGGLPKTGPNGVAAKVQAEMRGRGWSDDQLRGLGASGFNVRQVIDRADAQTSATPSG